MSDFFSGIQNARFPDLVMNQGPLPPTDGLPAPLHDTADGRINASSTLFGNMTPYAYGEPGYQSSQVSYVNHPHRIQKIFPELRLPRGIYQATDDFPISHPVDDSDIAFVMRLDRASTFCTLLKNPTVHRYKLGTAIDPFINLATVNYLLAGFQLCTSNLRTDPNNLWKDLLHSLDKNYFTDHRYENEDNLSLEDIVYIVRELITPFGVVRGSEKQGGQHEMTNAPVTWPVNFVGTLVIDGKERNVLNYWHNMDVSAGDDLCLRLKPMPIPPHGYVLNHYFKHVAKQDFKAHNVALRTATHVWQLVPDIFHLHAEDEYDPNIIMAGGNNRLDIPNPYHWQEWGYWHIGRTQVKANKTSVTGDYYNDDMAMNLRLAHLDMTFSPCWQKVPGRPLWKRNIGDPNKKQPNPTSGALNEPMKTPEKTAFLDTLFPSAVNTVPFQANSNWFASLNQPSQTLQASNDWYASISQPAPSAQPAPTASTGTSNWFNFLSQPAANAVPEPAAATSAPQTVPNTNTENDSSAKRSSSSLLDFTVLQNVKHKKKKSVQFSASS